MSATSACRLFLFPGYMTDDSLWHELERSLGELCVFEHIDFRAAPDVDDMIARVTQAGDGESLLCGFSMGGYAAREVARRLPGHVHGLVLLASSCRADTAQLRALRTQAVAATSASRFAGLSSAAIRASLAPARAGDRDLLERIRRMGANLGYEEFVRQSRIVRESDADRLAMIRCPTLVVAGGEDRVRGLDEAVELQAGIPGARLKVVEAAGHMLPLEQPGHVAGLIADWMLETLAARPRPACRGME